MPLIFGLLVIGVLAVASKGQPRQRLVDPRAALAADVRRLYAFIGQVLELPLPPIHFTADVANAASDGQRILVNPRWVRTTLDKHCANRACAVAAIVGVLVHELTHHAHGDAFVVTGWSERRARERRADRYAGFVVARLGLDSAHLEQVPGDPDLCCDLAHDPPWKRVHAVREGASLAWTSAA